MVEYPNIVAATNAMGGEVMSFRVSFKLYVCPSPSLLCKPAQSAYFCR